MATVYYDPGAAVNGSGTFLSPRNTTSGLTIGGAGEVLLQKAGSTRTTQITITVSGDLGNEYILGTYNPTTGSRITDGSQKALINLSSASGFGIFINAGISNVIIDGFEVMNLSGISAAGISHSATGGTNCNIRNSTVHDLVCSVADAGSGINLPTTSGEIYNVIVYNISGEGACGIRMSGSVPSSGTSRIINATIRHIDSDGIFFAREITIRGCSISDVGVDAVTANGDCIQGSGSLGDFDISYNYLDHTGVNFKQVMILQETGATTGGTIKGNTLLGCSQSVPVIGVHKTLQVDKTFCQIIGNYITEGVRGIDIDDTSNNCVISGNVIVQTNAGSVIGIRQGTGANNLVCNNTLIHTAGTGADIAGIFEAGTGVSGIVDANNVIVGYEYGIKTDTPSTSVVKNNCYYQCTQTVVNEALVPQAIDAASKIANPLLVDTYRIDNTSPCYQAGVAVSSVKSITGRDLPTLPSMGAFQFGGLPYVGGKLFDGTGELQVTTGFPEEEDGASYQAGWQSSAMGYAYTVDLIANAVPSTAFIHAGLPYTDNGSLYVTTETASGSDIYVNGIRVRSDGAVRVADTTPSASDIYRAGWARTSSGVSLITIYPRGGV